MGWQFMLFQHYNLSSYPVGFILQGSRYPQQVDTTKFPDSNTAVPRTRDWYTRKARRSHWLDTWEGIPLMIIALIACINSLSLSYSIWYKQSFGKSDFYSEKSHILSSFCTCVGIIICCLAAMKRVNRRNDIKFISKLWCIFWGRKCKLQSRACFEWQS